MPTAGMRRASRTPRRLRMPRRPAVTPGRSVSGMIVSAMTRAMSEKPEAMYPGAARTSWTKRRQPAAMAGPNVKPMPNAMPISAMPWARSFSEVRSAITAWAIDTVAPAIPAPTRATKRSVRPSAARPGDAPSSEATPKSA